MAKLKEKVVCYKCDLTLGLLEPDKTGITFKVREFYFYVRGGMIKIICWMCGSMNLIVDDKFEEDNPQIVNAEQANGHQRGVVKPWIEWADFRAKKKPWQNNGHSRPKQEIKNV